MSNTTISYATFGRADTFWRPFKYEDYTDSGDIEALADVFRIKMKRKNKANQHLIEDVKRNAIKERRDELTDAMRSELEAVLAAKDLEDAEQRLQSQQIRNKYDEKVQMVARELRELDENNLETIVVDWELVPDGGDAIPFNVRSQVFELYPMIPTKMVDFWIEETSAAALLKN